jgi:hypothetical protein
MFFNTQVWIICAKALNKYFLSIYYISDTWSDRDTIEILQTIEKYTVIRSHTNI